ncbi:MAG: biliverdin-producing heme oxygenase [bacterium]
MNDLSLRERIYTLTKPLHDRLDNDPASLRIMSSDVTLAEYTALLQRTYGFMKPLEDLLFSAPVDTLLRPVLGVREKRAFALGDDLVALSSAPTGLMSGLPTIERLGHAMGVVYVIEGSQMGGLVMAKQISRVLGLNRETGLKFFLLSDPKTTVKQFQEFVARLDIFAKCECDERDAIEAASETFRLIGDWFSR